MKDQDLDNEKEVAKLKRFRIRIKRFNSENQKNEVLMNKNWNGKNKEMNAMLRAIQLYDPILSKETKKYGIRT